MNIRFLLNFILLICLVGCVTASGVVSMFSQDLPQDKKKIKDFGKSLNDKKYDSKNKDSKKSDSKSDAITVNEDKIEDEEVLRVETNLVRTDVLVVNQSGQAVLGLKPSDFNVTENNIPQEIGTFSLGDTQDVPRSIVLIIDYSGSQVPYIQMSVNAAKVLVDKLNPKDKMAIVTDDIELVVSFTRDKEKLKKELDALAKHAENKDVGKSKQYSALMATLNELFDSEDVRPIVIFQTDGDEAFFISRDEPNGKRLTSFTVTDLFNKIEKSKVTIYSVISGFSLLGLSPEARLKKTELMIDKKMFNFVPKDKQAVFLQQYSDRLFNQQTSMSIVARSSGGFTERLETPDQADDIYSRILDEINNRYLLGYYPTNQEQDGTRRNVKIEVREHPEYVVWGRKFYFAPQGKKN